MEETEKTRSTDRRRPPPPYFGAILALDEDVKEKADRIGEALLLEVLRAGPAGMECKRIDHEDPVPFRVDRDPWGEVSWHLTLTYGGPAGDALGSRGRWSATGEVAAEGVLDSIGLVEALTSGRLSRFFCDLARQLEEEGRPGGAAAPERIREAAGIAGDLARLLEVWRDRGGSRAHYEMEGWRDGERAK